MPPLHAAQSRRTTAARRTVRRAVVSSFAIHHVERHRKHTLYGEVADLLALRWRVSQSRPRGQPDASAPREVARQDGHRRRSLGPVLCDLQSQLRWLSAVGLHDVDRIWKWRSLSPHAAARSRCARAARQSGAPPRPSRCDSVLLCVASSGADLALLASMRRRVRATRRRCDRRRIRCGWPASHSYRGDRPTTSWSPTISGTASDVRRRY